MEIEVYEDTVDCIIDNNTKWWDAVKIRTQFNPNVTIYIMKIILCLSEQEDKWIWAQERSGRLNVKSAYRFFRDNKIFGN